MITFLLVHICIVHMYRYWTIKICTEDFASVTFKVLLEFVHSVHQCRLGFLKVGTKFTSIWQISHVELTARTTQRLYEFKFMPIAEFGEFILLIGDQVIFIKILYFPTYTQKKVSSVETKFCPNNEISQLPFLLQLK